MKFIKSLQFSVSVFFIFMLFALLFMLLYSNITAMNAISNQVAESNSSIFSLYGKKIDDSLDSVRSYLIRTINDASENASIISLNNSAKGSSDYNCSAFYVASKLNKDSNNFMAVDALFAYSKNNDEIITFFTTVDYKQYYQKIDWLKKTFLSLPQDDYSMTWTVVDDGVNYELLKAVSDGTGCYIGALISIDRISALDGDTHLKNKLDTTIMSTDGRAYISTGNYISKTDIMGSAAFKNQSGYQFVKSSVTGNNYLVIVNKMNRSDLLFIETINENNIMRDLRSFQSLIYIFPVIVILLFFLYFIFLRKSVLNPVNEIQKGMKEVTQGKFDMKLPERGASELRFIINNFNSMVQQIKALRIDVYEEQLKAQTSELENRKAELMSLQLRINPHFFANSMNIIYNLAALKNFQTIQDLTLLMAKYFRYMIIANKSITGLGQEIEFVKNYLEIQKIRFRSKLSYEFDIQEEECLSYGLPPLVIQPFVENSILYGFTEKAEPLQITVRISKVPEGSPNSYMITVTDNGKGFPLELIEKLGHPENLENADGTHIGIHNVYYRLKMLFGEQFGIGFANEEAGGAVITLRLPRRPATGFFTTGG